MVEFLFLDLDETILDFGKAERIAVSKTLASFGVEPTDEICARYSQINQEHWKRLELGEISRDQVKEGRFAALFQELGREVEPKECTRVYESFLSVGHWFLPGAEAAVKRLSQKHRLFLASNGTASVQAGRLASANLYSYFEQVFISQEIGHNKPSAEFFDACFARISDFDRSKCLMVGDSLTSDILGGINAGVKTCWVNPRHAESGEIKPDYEIEALAQLPELLDTIG